jgi:hypothetical protein
MRPDVPVSEYEPIEHPVHQQDQNAEENLELRSQSGRIEERNEVVFEEPSGIGGVAPGVTERVFEWSEGAQESEEFEHDRPNASRDVNPGDARPSYRQQGAERYE